jgi:eukaryotic-like serine/threonine-protein kinase
MAAMSSSAPPESDFEDRWRRLALAEAEVELATDATLTARTLTTLRGSRTMAPPPGSTPAPSEDQRAMLPRISLGGSGAARGTAAASKPHGRSDLELRDLIGEGAMGRVHVARQHSLQRDVAVKTLKPRHDQAATVRDLLHEAVITGSLEHPGVVPVHVLGVDDAGSPVLVMKRIEGVDWKQMLLEPEHPGWRSRAEDRLVANLEILIQVCQAVHFAHSRGILHRDIKPENVMVGEFGEVYLVDWGIAVRLAEASGTELELVGTPAYMAPEMVACGPLDARTDVYLLGATLHEILTGELRHEGSTLHEVLATAFRSEPHAYDESVPEELATLCNAATNSDPAQRPASALVFRQALSDFLQHRGSITLAREALERHGQLRALLDEAGEAPPSDLARAYELATEARFGLALALRDWSDNPTAREGLSAAIAAAAELELRQGHAGAAAALLDELAEPPEHLVRKLEAVRRAQAEARAQQAQLRRMQHELDVRVSGRERTKALVIIAVVGAILSVWALTRADPISLRPDEMLTISLIALAAALVVSVVARRSLFRNDVNRRLMGAMIAVFVAMTLNRTVGVLLETPTVSILMQDLLIMAVMVAVVAITMVRWLWIVAGLFVGALLVCLAMPERTPAVFSWTSLLSVPGLLFALSRHARERSAGQRAEAASAEPEAQA